MNIQDVLSNTKTGQTVCGQVITNDDIRAFNAIRNALNLYSTMGEVMRMLEYNRLAIKWIRLLTGMAKQ